MTIIRIIVGARAGVVVLLAVSTLGCAGAASSNSQADGGSSASCAALTAAQQYKDARLVVLATALAGRTVQVGSEQPLASPARMSVDRYLKGRGPKIVEVVTAASSKGAGVTVREDGITPQPGERWKLFLDGKHSPYDTSICSGSKPVADTKP